ncbi:MAG: hypothetical protein H6621_08895 [Halobacteriovoraceae bacterium]|nr:hypothetical protein [Halobacteriovoraceae bacterium]MCB9095170.1 hypothetical protein [Halobacteriovoraceae bacterium]
MKDNNIGFAFFGFNNNDPHVEDFLKDVSLSKSDNFLFSDDVEEFLEFFQKYPFSIFLIRIYGMTDLASAVKILKHKRKHIAAGFIKTICQLLIYDEKLKKLLIRSGCKEFIQANVRPKAITHKLNINMKIITKKRDELMGPGNLRFKKKPQIVEKKKDSIKLNFVGPMNDRSDVWFMKNQNSFKKILNKHAVIFCGPAKGVVEWEKVKIDDFSFWRMIYKDSDFEKSLENDDGFWIFTGDEPLYEWDQELWYFQGTLFDLYYERERGRKYKIQSSMLAIDVCHNGDLGDTKITLIEESKKHVQVINERKQNNNDDDINDELAEFLKNQLSDDNLISSSGLAGFNPLKGKGKTDRLNRGNYEGQGKSDKFHDLSGKGKISKKKNDFWELTQHDQKFDDVLQGKIKTDRSESLEEYPPLSQTDVTNIFVLPPLEENLKNRVEMKFELSGSKGLIEGDCLGWTDDQIKASLFDSEFSSESKVVCYVDDKLSRAKKDPIKLEGDIKKIKLYGGENTNQINFSLTEESTRNFQKFIKKLKKSA